MKTIAIVGVVLVAIALVFVPGLVSHVRQTPKEVGIGITKGIPDPMLEREMALELDKRREEIRQAWVKVYGLQRQIERIEQSQIELKTELARKEEQLKGINGILKNAKPGGKVDIGQGSYSWEAINSDANKILGDCKVLRYRIEGNSNNISTLKQALESKRTEVLKAQEKLEADSIQFGIDKVKLAINRAQKDAAAEATSFSDAVGKLDNNSVISREWKRRVDEANTPELAPIASPAGTHVDWGKKFNPVPKATQGIDEYFAGPNTKPAAKPTVEAKK